MTFEQEVLGRIGQIQTVIFSSQTSPSARVTFLEELEGLRGLLNVQTEPIQDIIPESIPEIIPEIKNNTLRNALIIGGALLLII